MYSNPKSHRTFHIFMLGIRGKPLKVLQSLYNNVKSCVLLNGNISEFFVNNIGVLQGEIISPLLFSLYVNDCEKEFLLKGNTPIELQELSLFLLMYADDMVLLAESATELQRMLNALKIYTEKWSLSVNVGKTKVLVFRNRGSLQSDDVWFYDNVQIEIVEQFCYLGLLLNFNGKFHVTQKHLSLQCKKALFALKRKCTNMSLNFTTLLSLFDTYVGSIANYGCEVWGAHSAPDIEKVHMDFCKNILGLKSATTNAMIYFELGRLPLECVRKLRILKYWLKLLTTKNCILKSCYDHMYEEMSRKQNCKNWVVHVKSILKNVGLFNLWLNQYTLKPQYMFAVAKQRIFDNCKQTILSDINSSSKCRIYKHLIDHFTLQSYLTKRIPMQYKKLICKLRVSSHCLLIETGRYKNIPLERRVCPLCTLAVEDEFHFFFECPYYSHLRTKFLKKYYYIRPSVFKLIQLLSTQNVKELCNLGKFIKESIELRNTNV